MKPIFIVIAVVIFIILATLVLLKISSNNVDTMNNVNNCGSIGNKCSDEQTCHDGKCECKYLCKYTVNGVEKELCGCPYPDKTLSPYCTDFSTDIDNCGGCGKKCDPLKAEQCVDADCRTPVKVKEAFYYTTQSPYDFSNLWDDSSKTKLLAILKTKSVLSDIQIKCVMEYVMTKHNPDVMNLGLGDILNIISGYFDPGSKWRGCLDIK